MYLKVDGRIKDHCELALTLIGQIIANHEPNIVEIGIGVIIRDNEKKRGGKVIIASIKKLSGLLKHYANLIHEKPVDALIEIDEAIWCRMNDNQKKAVLHHELKHIKMQWDDEAQEWVRDEHTGRPKFSLIAHDKEEFLKIEEVYGPDWQSGLIEETEVKEEQK